MFTRIASLDMLRGLVIILMALDHTRDFMLMGGLSVKNIHEPSLFITRWMTHLCAPTFIFLAGVSAFLWQQNKTQLETFNFLFKRGIWLIFLEFTLVRLGWTFSFSPDFMIAQVIWAIGVSMIILSVLIFLSPKLIALFSLIIIGGHNLLDIVQAQEFNDFRWLWLLLHESGKTTPWLGVTLLISYPIIPWFAVMALGYSCAPLIVNCLNEKIRYLTFSGLALLLLFVLLRYTNFYGDPKVWETQAEIVPTILSFINCHKYPPSLLYLLMTLGLSCLLLAGLSYFEKSLGYFGKILQTFGKVPLFFYILHLPTIHLIALVLAKINHFETDWLFQEPFFSKPKEYGYSLAIVYLLWLFIIALLYPLCYQFAEIKKRHKDKAWLSYL